MHGYGDDRGGERRRREQGGILRARSRFRAMRERLEAEGVLDLDGATVDDLSYRIYCK